MNSKHHCSNRLGLPYGVNDSVGRETKLGRVCVCVCVCVCVRTTRLRSLCFDAAHLSVCSVSLRLVGVVCQSPRRRG